MRTITDSSRTIKDYITQFLEYGEVEKGLSAATVENYHVYLKNFTAWLQGVNLSGLKPLELNKQHIWDYRLYLSRKRSCKTIIICIKIRNIVICLPYAHYSSFLPSKASPAL